ncbi:MAG: HAMP domain-containing histidine kinase, partial [Clostridia bacterium]|nr:HAMP domain-containing histidine kinase [Clostridia bacterium]
MKKRIYSRYIVACLSLCVGILILFTAFSVTINRQWQRHRDENELEKAALNINQSITAMLALTGQDFQYLLEEEAALLFDALSAQKGDSDMAVFITDASGKILLSTEGDPVRGKNSLPDDAVSESAKMARQSKVYESSLDGYLPKAKLCRTLLLQKEHSQNRVQTVGMVYITLPLQNESFENVQLLVSLAAGLLLVAVGVLFFFVEGRMMRPLRELNEAAESFAKGDFSTRLDEESAGELTPLIRTFNHMAERSAENEKLRQTFVSNVSHDLRTPLTAIGGFVQSMRDGIIPTEKQGHYFDIILEEIRRLSRLVNTLLETSRMSDGKRKYIRGSMDLCEPCRTTLLSFEKRIEEKGIEVEAEFEQDRIYVSADRDAISQVIYNLTDNAIKFIDPGGKLRVAVRLQGQKAILSIRNTGDGIPEEELYHLFERFYKSDRSRGLDKKGMGLGLFIAKSVIDAHGEEIWVKS